MQGQHELWFRSNDPCRLIQFRRLARWSLSRITQSQRPFTGQSRICAPGTPRG